MPTAIHYTRTVMLHTYLSAWRRLLRRPRSVPLPEDAGPRPTGHFRLSTPATCCAARWPVALHRRSGDPRARLSGRPARRGDDHRAAPATVHSLRGAGGHAPPPACSRGSGGPAMNDKDAVVEPLLREKLGHLATAAADAVAMLRRVSRRRRRNRITGRLRRWPCSRSSPAPITIGKSPRGHRRSRRPRIWPLPARLVRFVDGDHGFALARPCPAAAGDCGVWLAAPPTGVRAGRHRQVPGLTYPNAAEGRGARVTPRCSTPRVALDGYDGDRRWFTADAGATWTQPSPRPDGMVDSIPANGLAQVESNAGADPESSYCCQMVGRRGWPPPVAADRVDDRRHGRHSGSAWVEGSDDDQSWLFVSRDRGRSWNGFRCPPRRPSRAARIRTVGRLAVGGHRLPWWTGPATGCGAPPTTDGIGSAGRADQRTVRGRRAGGPARKLTAGSPCSTSLRAGRSFHCQRTPTGSRRHRRRAASLRPHQRAAVPPAAARTAAEAAVLPLARPADPDEVALLSVDVQDDPARDAVFREVVCVGDVREQQPGGDQVAQVAGHQRGREGPWRPPRSPSPGSRRCSGTGP